jgi:hypothetical protein
MKYLLWIILTLSVFLFFISRLEIYTVKYDFNKIPDRLVFINIYDYTIVNIGIVDEDCFDCTWSIPYTTIYIGGYEIPWIKF